ncbi:MAG: signal peptidase I [Terriglobales bacterium]
MSDVLEQAVTETPAPPAAPALHKAGWLSSVQSLAVTVVIAVFVITFQVQAFQIPSESMENTLLIGDYLLVDKVHYGHGGRWGEILPYAPIQRGDIIVFRYPVHPQQHFVKRVIGLPGDHVRMVEGRVLVNGVPLKENYVIHTRPDYDHFRDDFPLTDIPNASTEPRWWKELGELVRNGDLIVPPDRFFVLGDNRDESLDSRYWGFVPRENIIGRPLLIYWSVRAPRTAAEVSSSRGDKLSAFLYGVTHLVQDTRWNRTFRIVR